MYEGKNIQYSVPALQHFRWWWLFDGFFLFVFLCGFLVAFWWLFPRVREFLENAGQFIPRLRFFFFSGNKLAHTNSTI